MKANVSPPDEEDQTKAAVLGYPPKQPFNPPPPHQYPAVNYPLHAYGPPQAYPGGHHGIYSSNQYHPSSTPGYYNPPSHSGYNYNSAHLRPQPPPHSALEYETRRSFAFARVILCLMVFLILMTSIMSLLTYIVFGSDIPIFQVASFSVPSFNITGAGSSLNATFEGSVTAENPNHKLDITFQHVEVGVGYHQLVLIAKKQIPPFELKKDGRLVLTAAPLSTPATGYGNAAEIWLKDMKSEYDGNRTVTFDMVLTVVATFKSGSAWSRKTMFKVVCEGLKTEFKDPGGAGVWDGVRQGCMVFG
ncbi:unnamed protein product [Cuscuta epithymum]|uniref:Late embryogenesis abundant protein LEA-2 subgroup domain-containing protein n=1 Tax=Cuscuta epithymum TaxID=186058 RepID=A0AAV0FI93_9ASTE|nr:unnamed protein product [Cuscuta epithymum]